MKKEYLTANGFEPREAITIDDVGIEIRIDFPNGSYENNIDVMVNPDFVNVRRFLESALTAYINKNNPDYFVKEL